MNETAIPAIDPAKHRFRKWGYPLYVRQLAAHHGWRGLVRQFRFQYRRPFSRALIRKHASVGRGIEIGVGAFTVAPIERTILTDGFREHASSRSIADFYCRADRIPCMDEAFDFVLSEHVLEHLANPLRALREWRRILKPGGIVFLFLPHRDRTFDRNRERTPLAHLLEDEARLVGDDDSTHVPEWKEKVIEPGLAPHYGRFPISTHVLQGLIHHHVWVTRDIEELVTALGFELIESVDLCRDRTDTFVVVARKKGL